MFEASSTFRDDIRLNDRHAQKPVTSKRLKP